MEPYIYILASSFANFLCSGNMLLLIDQMLQSFCFDDKYIFINKMKKNVFLCFSMFLKP